MTVWEVTDIVEADFGCEGRPDGYEPTDTVYLKSADGDVRTVQIKDAELYDKDINVGDQVYFDSEGQVLKKA